MIGGAKIAEPFLVPVVTAILLSYTLRPLVTAFERLHMRRIIGAALVIARALAVVSAIAYVIRDDFNAAVADCRRRRANCAWPRPMPRAEPKVR